MKQYKKVIIALLMAFVMAFVFTACGENNSKAVGSNESSSVSKEDTSSKVEKDKDKTDKDSSDKKTENKDDKQNTSKEDTSKKQDTQQKDNSQSNSAKSSNNQPSTQSNQQSSNNQQSNSSQNSQTQTPAPTPQPTPQPTPTPEPEPEPEKQCYLTIECKTILNNMSNLTPGKESLVPADGYILYKTAVTFKDGENVFDVLLRETRARRIHMEHEYTPGFGSEYIEGINNLYEFDCGSGSGWMYYVNGSKPNYGVSKYIVKEGDNIEFRYTCDLGWDL